jgi:hypothetical protein
MDMEDKDCLHCVHFIDVKTIDGIPVVYCDLPSQKDIDCSYVESEKGIVIVHGGIFGVENEEQRDSAIRQTVNEINKERNYG